jgi:hypothetical protein
MVLPGRGIHRFARRPVPANKHESSNQRPRRIKMQERSGASSDCVTDARSYSGVPLIALVFPVATLAATDGVEGVDQLDPAQIFRLLVAKLAAKA